MQNFNATNVFQPYVGVTPTEGYGFGGRGNNFRPVLQPAFFPHPNVSPNGIPNNFFFQSFGNNQMTFRTKFEVPKLKVPKPKQEVVNGFKIKQNKYHHNRRSFPGRNSLKSSKYKYYKKDILSILTMKTKRGADYLIHEPPSFTHNYEFFFNRNRYLTSSTGEKELSFKEFLCRGKCGSKIFYCVGDGKYCLVDREKHLDVCKKERRTEFPSINISLPLFQGISNVQQVVQECENYKIGIQEKFDSSIKENKKELKIMQEIVEDLDDSIDRLEKENEILEEELDKSTSKNENMKRKLNEKIKNIDNYRSQRNYYKKKYVEEKKKEVVSSTTEKGKGYNLKTSYFTVKKYIRKPSYRSTEDNTESTKKMLFQSKWLSVKKNKKKVKTPKKSTIGPLVKTLKNFYKKNVIDPLPVKHVIFDFSTKKRQSWLHIIVLYFEKFSQTTLNVYRLQLIDLEKKLRNLENIPKNLKKISELKRKILFKKKNIRDNGIVKYYMKDVSCFKEKKTAENIETYLRSVLEEKFEDIKCIIIDGGSSEESVVKNLPENFILHIRCANHGINCTIVNILKSLLSTNSQYLNCSFVYDLKKIVNKIKSEWRTLKNVLLVASLIPDFAEKSEEEITNDIEEFFEELQDFHKSEKTIPPDCIMSRFFTVCLVCCYIVDNFEQLKMIKHLKDLDFTKRTKAISYEDLCGKFGSSNFMFYCYFISDMWKNIFSPLYNRIHVNKGYVAVNMPEIVQNLKKQINELSVDSFEFTVSKTFAADNLMMDTFRTFIQETKIVALLQVNKHLKWDKFPLCLAGCFTQNNDKNEKNATKLFFKRDALKEEFGDNPFTNILFHSEFEVLCDGNCPVSELNELKKFGDDYFNHTPVFSDLVESTFCDYSKIIHPLHSNKTASSMIYLKHNMRTHSLEDKLEDFELRKEFLKEKTKFHQKTTSLKEKRKKEVLSSVIRTKNDLDEGISARMSKQMQSIIKKTFADCYKYKIIENELPNLNSLSKERIYSVLTGIQRDTQVDLELSHEESFADLKMLLISKEIQDLIESIIDLKIVITGVINNVEIIEENGSTEENSTDPDVPMISSENQDDDDDMNMISHNTKYLNLNDELDTSFINVIYVDLEDFSFKDPNKSKSEKYLLEIGCFQNGKKSWHVCKPLRPIPNFNLNCILQNNLGYVSKIQFQNGERISQTVIQQKKNFYNNQRKSEKDILLELAAQFDHSNNVINVLSAHNMYGHDLHVLRECIVRHGLQDYFKNVYFIETKDYLMGILPNGKWKLSLLKDHFHLIIENEHQADDDAYLLYQVSEAKFNQHYDNPSMIYSELIKKYAMGLFPKKDLLSQGKKRKRNSSVTVNKRRKSENGIDNCPHCSKSYVKKNNGESSKRYTTHLLTHN